MSMDITSMNNRVEASMELKGMEDKNFMNNVRFAVLSSADAFSNIMNPKKSIEVNSFIANSSDEFKEIYNEWVGGTDG